MRLKYVILKGFKAYKDETKVLFHPGANAIVGSNGSGKSSLLEAITLVVSEVYGKRTADVKAYFHRGLRNSVLTAFIELCFDNCDRRIASIDKDEVRFRRTFHHSGPKKDELHVDGKKVTKAEFSSMLEAGGFSKSNPYYVIRQGKIMEMAEMTDEGRLKLLKDFSGVQIYEEKRALAAESLQNSMDVASQADEQMRDLEKRLVELEAQKAELLEYRRLVNSVEVYRLAINDVEASEFEQRLKAIALRLDAIETDMRRLRSKLDECSSKIEVSQVEQKQIQNELSYKDREIAELADQMNALLDEQVTLEIQVQAKETDIAKKKAETLKRQEILRDQKSNSAELQEKLEKLEGLLVDAKLRKAAATQQHLKLNAEIQMFQDKRERCQKHRSNAARKSHLDAEIRRLEGVVEQSRKEQRRVQSDLDHAQKELERCCASQSREDLERIDLELKRVHSERSQTDQMRLKYTEEQTCIENELHASGRPTNTRHLLLREVDSLRSHVKDRTWRGLLSALYWDATIELDNNFLRVDNLSLVQQSFELCDSLHRLDPKIDSASWRRGYEADGLRIPGVLGPLWSLIRVPEQYRVAVSVAINVQLENVVCMNDSLASLIAADMKKRKADETINLAPLNQITMQFGSKAQYYPTGVYVPSRNEEFQLAEVKCVPLIAVISCPTFLLPVLYQIARKWLLVTDSDQSQQYTDAGFDCVTLDGDKLSSKGTLQGGHISPNGLLHAAERLRKAFGETIGHSARRAELERRHEEIRQELIGLAERKRDSDERYSRLTNEKLLLKAAVTRRQAVIDNLKISIERLVVDSGLIEQRLSTASNVILQNRRLLLSNENEKLTSDDIQHIDALEDSLSRLTKSLESADKEVEALTRQVEKVGRELSQVQEWIENNSQIDEYCLKANESACDVMKARLQMLCMEKTTLESCLTGARHAIEGAKEKLNDCKRGEESLRDQYERESRRLQGLMQESERLKAKEFELKQKIKVHEENKAALLSSSHFAQRDIDALKAEHSVQRLQTLLREGEKKLGDCPRVNEKAIEDLTDFQAEFAEKKVEQEQLRRSLESVVELMRLLDERRSQTLRMSFDLVNTNLQKIFSTLVPGGRAKLVIKKLSDDKVAEILMTTSQAQLKSHQSQGNEDPSLRESQTSDTTSPESDTQSSAYKVQVTGTQIELRAADRDPQWDQVARGIEIKASFRAAENPGDQTHFFPIVALSGGQKTVLALSLIFAMQRCDQAPFYIFDECDAALDEGYRLSVANLIKTATENSQFLITTFRRELCEICDRHFMVVTSDRVAQVKTVTKEDAVEVILREQEGVESQHLMIDAP